MKWCGNCNCEYNDDHKFCSQCGSELIDKHKVCYCPSCGKMLGENTDKFCPYCGYQIVKTNKTIGEQLSGITKRLSLPKISLTANKPDKENSEQFGTSENINDITSKEIEEFSFKEVLQRLFSFDGCIGRLEYFVVAILADLVSIGIQLYWEVSVEQLILQNTGGVMSSPVMAFVLILSLVVAVIKFAAITKRLHDLGKGGLWAIIACLASRQLIFDIILIMFLSIKKGVKENNEYSI